LEADHYRDYQVSAARVRLLETEFFPRLFQPDHSNSWVESLLEQFRRPNPSLGLQQAMGLRLRRRYWMIFAWAGLLWVLKLELATIPHGDIGVLLKRAAFSIIPGWLVWALVLGFYGRLGVLAWRAFARSPKATICALRLPRG